MIALVIDDSRAMRMILKRILAPLGFQVLEAGNGREAVDLLDSGGPLPDLALVDWTMPEMNGLEFVSVARTNPRLRGMTLIMVTTETEHAEVVRALAAGAHEYVIKPFTAATIAERLALFGLVPDRVAG